MGKGDDDHGASSDTAADVEPKTVGDKVSAADGPLPTSSYTNVPSQDTAGWLLFLRQMRVLLKNNFTLTVHAHDADATTCWLRCSRNTCLCPVRMFTQFLRWYKSTVLQIIAPFFFILFLFALQQGAKNADSQDIPHPTPYPLGGVPRCTVCGKQPADHLCRLRWTLRPPPASCWRCVWPAGAGVGARQWRAMHQYHVRAARRRRRRRHHGALHCQEQ